MTNVELTRRKTTVETETAGLEGEPQQLLHELYQSLNAGQQNPGKRPCFMCHAAVVGLAPDLLNELWKFTK